MATPFQITRQSLRSTRRCRSVVLSTTSTDRATRGRKDWRDLNGVSHDIVMKDGAVAMNGAGAERARTNPGARGRLTYFFGTRSPSDRTTSKDPG